MRGQQRLAFLEEHHNSALHHGPEEVVLRGEVEVDRALRDPGSGRDFFD